MAFEGFTVSPPYLGLDLVSPIDNMGSEFALELTNVFPGPGAPITRRGYTQKVNLAPANTAVNTLYPYVKQDGTTELIAVAAGTTPKIYKIVGTTATDITGTTAISTSGTNMNCQQFGTRLYLCNGVNNVQVYDGTTVADSTFSGVTLSNLINVATYKERLYFVERNTMKFWYGNTQAVGSSALNSFDLQYVMKQGGYLLFAGSYTNQVAQTSQDLFWAISSEGEIVFYSGSSPAADAWGLVARFVISKPLGFRSFIRVNNDVWILTQQGIIPISALFEADPEQALNVVSARVNPFISQYAKALPLSNRWQGMFWPQGRRIFINVPVSEISAKMLVYSIDTKAWCIYELNNQGDNISLAVADGIPYYGAASGAIYTAENGYTDNGTPIRFGGRCAFSFFGARGNFKAFKDIRPILRTTKGIVLGVGLDINFQRSQNVDQISTGTGISTPWGSPWGSPWSSGTEYIFNRYAVRGQGHCAAVRFDGTVSSSECQFYGFEVRFDLGGQV